MGPGHRGIQPGRDHVCIARRAHGDSAAGWTCARRRRATGHLGPDTGPDGEWQQRVRGQVWIPADEYLQPDRVDRAPLEPGIQHHCFPMAGCSSSVGSPDGGRPSGPIRTASCGHPDEAIGARCAPALAPVRMVRIRATSGSGHPRRRPHRPSPTPQEASSPSMARTPQTSGGGLHEGVDRIRDVAHPP